MSDSERSSTAIAEPKINEIPAKSQITESQPITTNIVIGKDIFPADTSEKMHAVNSAVPANTEISAPSNEQPKIISPTEAPKTPEIPKEKEAQNKQPETQNTENIQIKPIEIVAEKPKEIDEKEKIKLPIIPNRGLIVKKCIPKVIPPASQTQENTKKCNDTPPESQQKSPAKSQKKSDSEKSNEDKNIDEKPNQNIVNEQNVKNSPSEESKEITQNEKEVSFVVSPPATTKSKKTRTGKDRKSKHAKTKKKDESEESSGSLENDSDENESEQTEKKDSKMSGKRGGKSNPNKPADISVYTYIDKKKKKK